MTRLGTVQRSYSIGGNSHVVVNSKCALDLPANHQQTVQYSTVQYEYMGHIRRGYCTVTMLYCGYCTGRNDGMTVGMNQRNVNIVNILQYSTEQVTVNWR